MEYRCRARYGKFFRRLIATNQPADIENIVERYNRDLLQTEEGLLDLIIYSGGSLDYQGLMMMPLPAIHILITRMNKRAQDQETAMKSARRNR
jgi:hypothetical protein